ncbi:c-type cytochrome [Paenibacillus eucommiae]|uniref:Cytochrome c550 n=1 Tax=Paenibacillus eucommiae TaxID=1355755 RepID=A0ABS4IQ83_9BACL|nr:cytochrome c [Paenibacillus eucommiae]MBP1989730.1 cytochrome c550 [Paenibacillus eucommiae]
MYKWIMAVFCGIAVVIGFGVLFNQISERQNQAVQEEKVVEIPDAPVNAEAAEAIYKQSCLACHGKGLEGQIGPNLQKVGDKLTKQQIYKMIQNGKGGMPSFKSSLKDDEISNLALWLAEKK